MVDRSKAASAAASGPMNLNVEDSGNFVDAAMFDRGASSRRDLVKSEAHQKVSNYLTESRVKRETEQQKQQA